MIPIAPPVQNPIQNEPPAIVYRMEVTQSAFWMKHTDVFPKESASIFWTRERQFMQLTESTRKAKAFEKGWDGYDASAPNDTSVTRTLEVLSRVRDSKLSPYSVLPSADGGVGISFRGSANKRAVLELLNDGTSSYILYGKGHPIESSEFNSNTDLPRIFQRLEEYL
jgi:hypothetical protein